MTNNTTLETACPHTIQKFMLIENYVKEWAQKLLNFADCEGIVFIDCMCNSGIYRDKEGMTIVGTPIRVSNYISRIMPDYPTKKAWLCFNDFQAAKTEELRRHLPDNSENFHISLRNVDGNELLKEISSSLWKYGKYNYLLVYDPYEASVDWNALLPFLQHWGEVIINHMVSDPVRGVSQAKRSSTIIKYEQTYLSSIKNLVTFGSDRTAYERRVQEIISDLRGYSDQCYYVASFPFFNTKNALVYNLIHCSGNIEGTKLFKKTAWKLFGGRSSSKDTHGRENQLMLDLDDSGNIDTVTDDNCYNLYDVAKYLRERFMSRVDVLWAEVWQALDEHPVFPSDGFKRDIKALLRDIYGCTVTQKSVSFYDRG